MAKSKKQAPDSLSRVLAALGDGEPQVVGAIVAALHPADIATLLESIPPNQRHAVWTLVPAPLMGEVLLEVSEGVRAGLLAEMDGAQLVTSVKGLDTDDIADLIPDLPDEVIAEILYAMDQQDRQRLDTVLSFPEDTAGGLMNVDTITVRENINLEVVLRYLRRRGELPEHTNGLFVVDRGDRLLGVLSLARLLTSDANLRVAQVMDREPVKFAALMPDHEVAAAFERYNLVTAPVIDDQNRLLGRITVDDVVDVIREQADRTVMAQVGLSEEEDIFAPVVYAAKRRALWLGINLLTAFLASWVVSQFEYTIEKIVALAVLMPIVAGMGGNAGTQTLAIVIRGLALGQISGANARRVLTKQLAIGSLNGVVWALVVGVVAFIAYDSYQLGLIIGAAMVINLAAAALAGVVLPLMVKKFGVDPALGATVMLTTVTDVVGFFAFLGLATVFLL